MKWRRYNPISWFLCWLFEQNVALMPGWFFCLHDWFCPEEREAKEENKAREIQKIIKNLKGELKEMPK